MPSMSGNTLHKKKRDKWSINSWIGLSLGFTQPSQADLTTQISSAQAVGYPVCKGSRGSRLSD
ncbi:MAG TPA: hypothetical protein PLO50_10790, partial [Nitrospira sp.]|nr:hypothetical protein [Nitrospira sp.]